MSTVHLSSRGALIRRFYYVFFNAYIAFKLLLVNVDVTTSLIAFVMIFLNLGNLLVLGLYMKWRRKHGWVSKHSFDE